MHHGDLTCINVWWAFARNRAARPPKLREKNQTACPARLYTLGQSATRHRHNQPVLISLRSCEQDGSYVVFRSVDWVVQRLINDRWTSAASAFLVILIASQIWVPAVTAHDWYPVECCRGKDCAEVEHASYAQGPGAGNDLPILTVTTQHGTALV